MDKRILIVHAGGGKAGSSALQSALSRSAAELDKLGITYADPRPLASAYEISSGNGLALFQALGEPDWIARGKSIVESLIGGNPVGICSSEFLGSLTRTRWQELVGTAGEVGIEIKAVYFVRAAVGYVVSDYNQNIKRHGEARSFADAARETPWQHYDQLVEMEAALGTERLTVINYDVARKDLGGALADAVPELAPAKKLLKRGAEVTVNRSLTSAELEVLRHINAQFGAAHGHELSDRMIYDAPELRADASVPPEVAEVLRGKFEAATNWINERFFSGGGGLTLSPPKSKAADTDKLERPLRIALDWALEKLGNRRSDISFIRERLLAIDWAKSGHPDVPADFDPIAYLLLNPDVLLANDVPYAHFIESGRAEGREYRWPLNLDPSIEAPTADAIAKFRLDDSADLAGMAVWPRLRHILRLEALLHEFAERERDYLQLIRKLREGRGYESEQFRQQIGKLIEPLYHLVEGVRREANDGSVQRAAEARMLEDSGRAAAADLNAQLTKVAEELGAQIAALREKQAELNAALESKDAELERYRRMGLIDFLRSRR